MPLPPAAGDATIPTIPAAAAVAQPVLLARPRRLG